MRVLRVVVALAAAVPVAGAVEVVSESGVVVASAVDPVAAAAVEARAAYGQLMSVESSELAVARQSGRRLVDWAQARDRLAVLVDAERAPLLSQVWSAADPVRVDVTLAALSQVGARYRYASSDPERGFDCSGLTSFAWAQAGVAIAGHSGAQAQLAEVGVFDAQPGDVAWYPGHVMLYIGAGMVVHAANSATGVVVDPLERFDRIVSPLP